jgi:predicted ester cyclase
MAVPEDGSGGLLPTALAEGPAGPAEVEAANIAVVRGIVERLNAGDVEGAAQLMAEDLVDHNPAAPGRGRMGFLLLHGKILHTAFPDMQVVQESVIADGDTVVSRVRMQATSLGPFMGIPPTGATVTATGIEVHRLAGGLVVEHWAQFDLMAILRQLGAIIALPVGPPAGGPPPPRP